MNKIVALGAFLLAAVGGAIPSAQATLNAAHFSGWNAISTGLFNTGPAIMASAEGKLAVFGRGLDDRYYQNAFTASNWGSWTIMAAPAGTSGGTFGAAPACTSWPSNSTTDGKIIVGVGYNDDRIYVQVSEPLTTGGITQHAWHQPAAMTSFPGSNTFTPAAVVFFNKHIYITKSSSAGSVYLYSNDVSSGYSSTNWVGPFLLLNKVVNNAPAMITTPDTNFLRVVAEDASGKFWMTQASVDDSASNPFGSGFAWKQVGGGTYATSYGLAGAGTSGWSAGHSDVFGTGTDSKIWVETSEKGVWSTSGLSLGGPAMASRPAAASWGTGHIAVVALAASDSKIYVNTYHD